MPTTSSPNQAHCLRCSDLTIVRLVDGYPFCEECLAVATRLCGECNSQHIRQSITSVAIRGATVSLCRNCRDNYLFCHNCNAIYTRENDVSEGQGYCPSCHSHYFRECCDCGRSVHINDINSRGTCSDCRRAIHDYSFRPRPTFFGGDAGPHYGTEIEMECGDSSDGPDENARMLNKRFWYPKYDGSIGCGFEAVSHPATLKYWQKDVDLDVFSKLAHNGCRSGQTTTCGMHVHVAKKFWSELQLYKALEFFRNEASFILKFSMRKPQFLQQWANISHSGNAQKAKSKGDSVRYMAINLVPEKTIEFRLFKGTLRPSGILRNIEFVHCLWLWTGEVSLRKLDKESFIAFATRNRSSFPNLAKQFKDRSY